MGRAIATEAFLFLVMTLFSAAGSGPVTPIDNPSSVPEKLAASEYSMFFTANDGIHGQEPWIMYPDGSCKMMGDLMPGPEGSKPAYAHGVGPYWYFLATASEGAMLGWVFGPEDTFPRVIRNSETGDPVRQATVKHVLADKVYLSAGWNRDSKQLYSAPWGKDQVVQVFSREEMAAGFAGTTHAYWEHENVLYGGDRYTDLWRTDFTEEGTWRVRRNLAVVTDMVDMGPFALMGALDKDAPLGYEIWRTDGTAEGTKQVKDLYPGAASGILQEGAVLDRFKDGLLFLGSDGSRGEELWASDGTEEGTRLVKDIQPGFGSSSPYSLVSSSSWAVFVADDGQHGNELWRTDGTQEGTHLLRDVYPGPTPGAPWRLCLYKGRVYFGVSDPVGGEEPWVTDGTVEGTHQFVDIVPGPGSSGVHQFTVFNDLLYFTCDDGIHGEELWVTDGTPQGAHLARDIATPLFNPSSSPRQLTALGACAAFVVRTPAYGEEVWISDGTEAGTQLLHDAAPGPPDSSPRQLTALGERLLFTADTPEYGREWWVSDGAGEGARLLRDTVPGPRGSAPESPCRAGAHLFYLASAPEGGHDLWRTDGTPAGTLQLTDLSGESPPIGDIFALAQNAYFYLAARDAFVLWQTDGLPAGTRPLFPFPRDWLHADLDALREPVSGQMPPPPALTAFLAHPPDAQDQTPAPVFLEDTCYFARREAGTGCEPWITDGTFDGTRMLRDIYPGPPSSSPACFISALGSVYFTADTPVAGRILWRSDPATGANRVQPRHPEGAFVPDVRIVEISDAAQQPYFIHRYQLGADPEIVSFDSLGRTGVNDRFADLWDPAHFPPDRAPRNLTVAAQKRVYVTFDDGVHGEELYMGVVGKHAPHLVKDILTPADLRALRPNR